MSGERRAQPRVVACLPAWNAAAFIRPVLDSLAAQTWPNLAIRISVDAGDDDTAAICRAFADRHANATVACQASRLGWIGNARWLLKDLSGDYAFFAFHDDPLHPTYVERLVAALEANPRAVLAFSDVESNIGGFSYGDLEGITDRFERARRILLPSGPWWVPNRGLFRTAAARQLGGPRRHWGGEYGADWPWLLRLALLGEFVRVPEPLISKAFRTDGLSATWTKSRWRRLAVRLALLGAIREAGFPPRQELSLHAQRLVLWLREEYWRVRRRSDAHGRAL